MTFPSVLRSTKVWLERTHLRPIGFSQAMSSGVFARRTARYQLFGRVDQEVLQLFHCAEHTPFSQLRLKVFLVALKVFFSGFILQCLSGRHEICPGFSDQFHYERFLCMCPDHFLVDYVILKVPYSTRHLTR